MKHYRLITILIILTLSLTACQKKPDPVDIVLDLEFESESDINWVSFPPELENLDMETIMVNGVLHMSGENQLFGLNMKYNLEPGLLVHYRPRSSEAGPCYSAGLGFDPDPAQNKTFSLGGCPDSLLNAEVVFNRDHFGDSIGARLPIRGSVPVVADAWVDLIFWITPERDQLYFFATNTDDPEHVTYGSVLLPEDWQVTRWNTGIAAYFEDEEGGVDVDFARIAKGPLASYLYYNVPAYLENQEEIDQFLEQSPEPMPELN